MHLAYQYRDAQVRGITSNSLEQSKQKKRVFVREARPRSPKDDAGNGRRGKENYGGDAKNVAQKILVQELGTLPAHS